MTEMTEWDLIVVGAGPMGLSTAWNYARANAGKRVLVIDQHSLMNQFGGSSGEERHWRLQYTELEIFRLTTEAHTLWRELETLCDRRLIFRIGSLWFGDPEVRTNEGQIKQTMASMDEMELPYERLSVASIEERYGFRDFDRNYEGFLQPDGGVIDVRSTISSLYYLGTDHGVQFDLGSRVEALEPDANGVTVVTRNSRYHTKKVALVNGAGGKAILAKLGVNVDLSFYEMTCVGLKREAQSPKPLPFWFLFQQPTEEDTNLFYGFPPNPWSVNKYDRMGANFEVDAVESDEALTYRANPRHLERSIGFIQKHMPFLSTEADCKTSTCVAVLSNDPGRLFYLDTAENKFAGGENVIVCLGGWTFKFIPLMGKLCADLATTGQTQWDIDALRF